MKVFLFVFFRRLSGIEKFIVGGFFWSIFLFRMIIFLFLVLKGVVLVVLVFGVVLVVIRSFLFIFLMFVIFVLKVLIIFIIGGVM